MKFLLKKTYDEVEVNDNALLLADMFGLPAGTRGTVIEKCKEEVDGEDYRFVRIQWLLRDRPSHTVPMIDSFSQHQIFLLAFECKKENKTSG